MEIRIKHENGKYIIYTTKESDLSPVMDITILQSKALVIICKALGVDPVLIRLVADEIEREIK